MEQKAIDEEGNLVKRRPDLVSENYIVECKTGKEPIDKDAYSQAWDNLLIATQKAKREDKFIEIVYWYLKRPSPGDEKTINFIKWLENCGITVQYGEDIFGGG